MIVKPVAEPAPGEADGGENPEPEQATAEHLAPLLQLPREEAAGASRPEA